MCCAKRWCSVTGAAKAPSWGGPRLIPARSPRVWEFTRGLVTKVGPDAPSDLLQPLSDAGVDLRGVDFESPITTTNQLVYAPDGTKELKYLKQAAAIAYEDIVGKFPQALAYHVCPLDYEISIDTIGQIARLGKLMSVDLGGYGGAHICRQTAAQKKLSPPALKKLIGLFDIVKASDEDVRIIFSGDGLSEEAAALYFLDAGAKVAIVTLGAKGSLVFTRDLKCAVPALAGDVRDVTGGGDSYLAGFLVEWLRTSDPVKSGMFASAVALSVIEKTGGVRAERMPTELEARNRIPPQLQPQVLQS